MKSFWQEKPLLAVCLTNVFYTASNSIVAPFYPIEAIERGVSLQLIAIFFAAYPISKLISFLIA